MGVSPKPGIISWQEVNIVTLNNENEGLADKEIGH